MSEEEKQELRRQQQEKALRFQQKVDLELKEAESKVRERRDKMVKENELVEKDDGDDEEEPISQQELVKTEAKEENFMDALANDVERLDLGEKFESMLNDYDKSIDRENNQRVAQVLKKTTQKKVKWNDSDDRSPPSSSSGETDEEQEEDDEKEESGPFKIIIKHTKSEKIDELQRNERVSRDKPEINSPADIFNQFYKPKSILKKTSEEPTEFPPQQDTEIRSNESKDKFEPSKVIFSICFF
jgi:hypothetical protein